MWADDDWNGARLVSVGFQRDEALVLDAFLARGQDAGDNYSAIEDQAELRVLWDMSAIIESLLPELLSTDYDKHLAAARAAVRDSEH